MRTKHAMALSAVIAFGGTAIAAASHLLLAEQSNRIADSLRQLAQFRAQTSVTSSMSEHLREIQRRAASLPGLLETENPSVAAAELQGEINAIVQRHRGEVTTSQTLPPETVNGFERIAVRNELSVPIMSVRAVVYGVETHVPYLFIERLTISGPRDWPQDIENAPEPKLVISWTVYAFRRSAPV